MWLLPLLACTPDPPAVDPDPAPVHSARHTDTPLALDYVVDASDPASGDLTITLTMHGADPRGFLLKRNGGDAVPVRDVTLRAVGGDPIPLEAHPKRWVPPEGTGGDLVARWVVTPGGEGRHGHQGYVHDDFVVFDGRAFVVPRTRNPIGKVRMRFVLPDGWRVASALTRDDEEGWWVLEAPADDVFVTPRLFSECYGLGPFELDTATFGTTEVRAWTHPRTDDAVRAKIVRDTLGEARFFHEALGFDPGLPMSFVRTPAADPADGEETRIFGGASLTGACWEDTHHARPTRNELLLGHRFGHPYNRYPPTGLGLRDARDRWFSEGWASYIEVIAAEAAGAMPDRAYFTTIYHQHLGRLEAHPDWTLALGDEPRVRGEQVEYVHYIRGPLAVALLGHLVEERTDTTLEAVMRGVAAEHGGHRGVWSLPEALHAHTGQRFDDFFEAAVDTPGPLAPVWPGYVDAVELADPAPPAAATAGTLGVSGDYLQHLAASGDFSRYSEIAAFVAAEPTNRAALRAAGVTLAHAEVLEVVERLPAAVRYELAKAEADWPIERAGGRRRTPARITWNRDDPDGAAFADVLAAEATYEAALGRSGVRKIELHPGSGTEDADAAGPQLAVAPDTDVVLYSHWLGHPALTAFVATSGDETPMVKEVVVEPGWMRTRVGFPADERPDGAVLTFTVGPPDGPTVQRAFWQRTPGPPRPAQGDPPPPE